MPDKLEKPDRVELFIEMRARGFSYDYCAKTLKTSKTTLIDWANKYQQAISNMRSIQQEARLEEFKMTRRHQIEVVGKRLAEVREELAKRDLSHVATDKLISLEIKLLDVANKFDGVKLKTGTRILPFGETEWEG